MIEPVVIRNRCDLIEVLRARKEQLGLSNVYIETQLQMADGGADKVLGPSTVRGMSLSVMFDIVELFGCRLVIQPDPELEAKMQNRWARRDERSVRQQARLSRQLLEIANKQFYTRLSRLGNEARKAKLPPEARSNIARAAAISRWQRHRAAVKAASASEGARA
jgi:hypothetical protein